jgi:hypothetical protein
MKHIHFVIYRLKSIIVVIFIYLFINSFFNIFIYLEIKFIKPFDDVKIQGRAITFFEDENFRTVFINKMINSGIMRMFIFFITFVFICSILLAKCYVFAQMILVLLV